MMQRGLPAAAAACRRARRATGALPFFVHMHSYKGRRAVPTREHITGLCSPGGGGVQETQRASLAPVDRCHTASVPVSYCGEAQICTCFRPVACPVLCCAAPTRRARTCASPAHLHAAVHRARLVRVHLLRVALPIAPRSSPPAPCDLPPPTACWGISAMHGCRSSPRKISKHV